MNTVIINEVVKQVNFHQPLAVPPGDTGLDILIIRTFDKKGEWQLEVIFSGGAKVTGPVTTEEVSIIESDLSDRGWQIEPSLWSNGFNAKPGTIGFGVEGLGFGPDTLDPIPCIMWPEDYGLAEVTL